MLIYRCLRLSTFWIILTLCVGYGLAHDADLIGYGQTVDGVSEEYRDWHDTHGSVDSYAYGYKRIITRGGEQVISALARAYVTTEMRLSEPDGDITTGSYWVYADVYQTKGSSTAGERDDFCGEYSGEISKWAFDSYSFDMEGPDDSGSNSETYTMDDIGVDSHADVHNQLDNPETGEASCDVSL